jgi:3',5'-cyclic AMP phosphodiesterase CpdA
VVRAAAAAVPDARFVVHAGDLVAEGYDDSLWQAWTDAMQPLSFAIPNLPVPGNHDLHRSPSVDASGAVFGASPLWRAHFALPDNGPAVPEELAGHSYALDYQGVRIVAVDVNAFANGDYLPGERQRVREAQVAWVRRALAANASRWTIVVEHEPVFPAAKKRDYPDLRAALQPIYEQGGVDLVLQGHDHLYARTHKVRGSAVVAAGARGIIYTIAVAGSKRYAVDTLYAGLMAVLREDTATFQVIGVSPSRLSYESRTPGGELVDAFEITKTGVAPSVYVNRAPGASTSGPVR